MATSNYQNTGTTDGRLGQVKARAAGVGDQLGTRIEGAPLVALAAGVVAGAVAGALMPRTNRETELLGPVGSKIGQAAVEAVRAAKDAGKEQLGILGENKSPMEMVMERAVDAVSAAGTAAGSAAASTVSGKHDT